MTNADPYSNLKRLASSKVRVVIRHPGPASHEFFNLVGKAHKKNVWTLKEWQELLAKLDASDDTVQDYLDLLT